MSQKKLSKLFEEASRLLELQHWESFDAVLTELTADAALKTGKAHALWAESLRRRGRFQEARQMLEGGLLRFPKDAELHAQVASDWVERGNPNQALVHFAKAKEQFRREPSFLAAYGNALLQSGRTAEAESQLAASLLCGGGDETRLVIAALKAQRGRIDEALQIAERIAQRATGALRRTARVLVNNCKMLSGDPHGAVQDWLQLQKEGPLVGIEHAYLALAAQLSNDASLAAQHLNEPIAETAEAAMVLARISNEQKRYRDALVLLEHCLELPGLKYPSFEIERTLEQGRAQAGLGQPDDARMSFEAGLRACESKWPRLEARIESALGQLHLAAGEFERAGLRFTRAVALDEKVTLPAGGLDRVTKELAWKQALAAESNLAIEAVKAKAAKLEAQVRAREQELLALQSELKSLKQAQAADAVATPVASQTDEVIQSQWLKRELELREAAADEAAHETVAQTLGPFLTIAPEQLTKAIWVAERTYQRATFTDLPAAAIAVLYSGALERSLFVCVVQPLDRWLNSNHRRAAFLAEGLKSETGGRREYFDRFVEAFDTSKVSAAPALGEVLRVLSRRNDSSLKTFRSFLDQHYQLTEAEWDGLAEAVQWAKENVRDPVAHGRGIDLHIDQLKRLRGLLMQSCPPLSSGVFKTLVAALQSPAE